MEYRLIPKALNLKPNQNVALISVDALEERDAYNLVVSFLNEVGTYGWLLLVTSKPQLWHEQLKDKDIMHRTIITRMSRLRICYTHAKAFGKLLGRSILPSAREWQSRGPTAI